jgi:hypothetical protein
MGRADYAPAQNVAARPARLRNACTTAVQKTLLIWLRFFV